MRDVKATGRSRGENENGGIRVGSRLGKKGHLCRKTFVRLLCLTAAMMVLGSFTAFARAGGASGGGGGGEASAKTVTNSLGGQVGGGTNPLATKAAERAMNINNPNK